jgi:hypothetical protein
VIAASLLPQCKQKKYKLRPHVLRIIYAFKGVRIAMLEGLCPSISYFGKVQEEL